MRDPRVLVGACNGLDAVAHRQTAVRRRLTAVLCADNRDDHRDEQRPAEHVDFE